MTDDRLSESSSWIVSCTHPDYAGEEEDFSDLADGAGDEAPSGVNVHNWLGGFVGRPGLLNDLMPTIVVSYRGRSPVSLANLKGALRSFWRFLDSYEEWQQSKGLVLPPVDRLHMVSGVMLELFSQPGPDDRWKAANDTRAALLRALILDAVHQHELPNLNLAVLARRRGTPRDTPSEEEGLAIIRHLRAEVSSIFRRWQRADMLAAIGKDLIPLMADRRGRRPAGLVITEADAHATYRALVGRVGHPFPTIRQLLHELRLGGLTRHTLPKWWPRYQEANSALGRAAGEQVTWTDCTAGLYPTSGDVATCALLCLARSAWNPSTLLNLDVENWWATYDQDSAWIFAPKERARGALQHTISAMRHPTGVYRVVERLIQRNASIRKWINDNQNPIEMREIALRSPWLGWSRKPSESIFVGDPCHTNTLNNWLKRHISRYNELPSRKIAIPPMSSSDFRDVAAALMYKDSHYSMWVVMVLLGHKSLSTTRTYVLRRSSRQESHALVAQAMNDKFRQIEQTRSWDPVVTRARVEDVPITPDGLQRLDEDRKRRTYSGAVCRSPFSPPTSIDPNNPQDGKSRCIQGHLCVARGCPNAIVLNDSLSDICKTVAELEWRKAHTGVVRFAVGSEERDLDYLLDTLKQWPVADVETELSLWRARIESGEHIPLIFGGQH